MACWFLWNCEDAIATVLTTIAGTGSPEGPSIGGFSKGDPLLLRQVVIGEKPSEWARWRRRQTKQARC